MLIISLIQRLHGVPSLNLRFQSQLCPADWSTGLCLAHSKLAVWWSEMFIIWQVLSRRCQHPPCSLSLKTKEKLPQHV